MAGGQTYNFSFASLLCSRIYLLVVYYQKIHLTVTAADKYCQHATRADLSLAWAWRSDCSSHVTMPSSTTHCAVLSSPWQPSLRQLSPRQWKSVVQAMTGCRWQTDHQNFPTHTQH